MNIQRCLLSFLCIVSLLLLSLHAVPAQAQFTLLIPDQPTMEQLPQPAEKSRDTTSPDKNKNTASDDRQMDVLIALTEPAGPQGLDMDMPQMFAVIRYYESPAPVDQEKQDKESRGIKPHREDLLGELEEIRYLDKKAWAVNVPLSQAGLYQLITESRPWWNEQRDLFQQHFVKTIVPVYGRADGWDKPAGLKFEIVPLTRPFGAMTPGLFTGKVLLSGEPLADAYVKIARINTDRTVAASPWQNEQLVKTDSDGIFSFVCPLPGWWGFMALTEGDPLKSADGQPKKLEMGAELWVYMDEIRTSKAPRTRK